ncbi:MAG: bifunctional phosphopantothenoylcysteine decarboxylase/phosphopantothenate--cysteine ligase CoaBC [Eubacterium sp.]|nr:bifunctional phosphopantothenoylcysteine decarboxylase/phosphopantothenate--cysteine ligase CoaBC [Eubacterium sp.]
MLKGKNIVIGLTGSVAVYKICELIRLLVKAGCNVDTIMTESAARFINPYLIEELSKSKCITDTFERVAEFDVKHISLANKADMFVVAPATANVVGKIANGIADDMLTTTIMATKAPKMIAPAMNPNMYSNPIFRNNLKRLSEYEDYIILPTGEGEMACGDFGSGRMLEPKEIFARIKRELSYEKVLKGKNVLVTCGATMEDIDPVRFITNHSSGKMGFAIAETAASMGAEVTLIKGNTTAEMPYGLNVINVKSAADMFEAVKANYEKADYIFKAAAVADYTPKEKALNKIKKADGNLLIELKRTDDILKFLGENRKEGTKICGFSMETEDLIKNSSKKLTSKNVDMIAANSIANKDSGFGTDTNRITIITKDGNKELPLMTKEECACEIIKTLIKM